MKSEAFNFKKIL